MVWLAADKYQRVEWGIFESKHRSYLTTAQLANTRKYSYYMCLLQGVVQEYISTDCYDLTITRINKGRRGATVAIYLGDQALQTAADARKHYLEHPREFKRRTSTRGKYKSQNGKWNESTKVQKGYKVTRRPTPVSRSRYGQVIGKWKQHQTILSLLQALALSNFLSSSRWRFHAWRILHSYWRELLLRMRSGITVQIGKFLAPFFDYDAPFIPKHTNALCVMNVRYSTTVSELSCCSSLA